MSNFDGLQKTVFTVVENLYGDVAVWSPSSLTPDVTEKVLFNYPNNPIRVGEADKYEYRPYDYSLEYFNDQFIGLKESVDNNGVEKIVCNGFNLVVRAVYCSFDGKTQRAYCELDYIEPE